VDGGNEISNEFYVFAHPKFDFKLIKINEKSTRFPGIEVQRIIDGFTPKTIELDFSEALPFMSNKQSFDNKEICLRRL
jgi:hypothetical protein